jgi:hypothetical protein
VGKGKRVDVYLEVRKRRGIYFERGLVKISYLNVAVEKRNMSGV